MSASEIEASYIAGLDIRKKLTESSAKQINDLLHKFSEVALKICNKETDKERNSEKFTLSYGSETSPDKSSVDFILKEAVLTFGYYDYYEVRVDCLGIFVSFKAEHKSKEVLLSVYWDMYESLKKLNFEMFN